MSTQAILSYHGSMSFSAIDHLISELRPRLEARGLSSRTYKKLVTIIIEALENVSKYSDQFPLGEDPKDPFCPTADITCLKKTVRVCTRNPVKSEDVADLKKLIDQVNACDGDQLKKLYMATITNGKFSDKGGAGLGFIEMAKTSENRLSYKFEKLSEEYRLYYFCVDVNV